MARTILWGSLVLAPVAIATRFVFHADDTVLFVLAAVALVPLAWLIGEATEQAAEHTGPGVGGFLNASFGNAPELIIALFAVGNGLPDVVRGSLAGSVVSNILLVLGVALIFGPNEGRLNLRSLSLQLGLVVLGVLAFLLPALPALHGNPNRHSLAVLSIPVAVGLLLVYVVMTGRNLRRDRQAHSETDAEAAAGGWTLPVSLGALAAATIMTALISELLVHSLESFAHTANLSEFFIAAVIVAIVGNAAEHGGAIVIARRGKIKLATEIAISSSAQVALFVAPAIVLLSFFFAHPLALSFRPVELAAMGGAAVFVAIVIRDGVSKRWEGWMLVGVYAAVAATFLAVGDR
ncbi:MAG: Ca2+:H+ antiporter [Gaiellaceae bacterium]|nr:Ca2+:H+ antiporter [Gaiellaceae bacterium]